MCCVLRAVCSELLRCRFQQENNGGLPTYRGDQVLYDWCMHQRQAHKNELSVAAGGQLGKAKHRISAENVAVCGLCGRVE